MFWARLENQVLYGPNLARNPQSSAWKPQPGLQIPELFSGPHSGTFFCTKFVAFPGMPSLVFCRHYFVKFLEMQKIMLGQLGRHYFRHFLEMRRISCRKKFRNGAQKKVPESAGLVGTCPSLTSDRSATWLLEAATAADFDQA